MKFLSIASLITAAGLLLLPLSVFAPADFVDQPTTAIASTEQIDAAALLEKARSSTFLISMTDYHLAGTAILVGRKKLDGGSYRYRALTAYHVVRTMFRQITIDRAGASKNVALMFQPTFHGPPLRIDTQVNDIDWTSPTEDWASFTFDSTHRLVCVEVATSVEFHAIKSFEKIYAVGCSGRLYGQMCREGVIGATHSEHLEGKRWVHSKYPWNKRPHKFFRPYINIWYGDSGGGVFSKHGKLIGIINGFGIMTSRIPSTPISHSAIAIKAHIVRNTVLASKDFFLVEG